MSDGASFNISNFISKNKIFSSVSFSDSDMNSNLEYEINFNSNNDGEETEFKLCGAEMFPWLADIIGGIVDDLDGESKDGKIGDTRQVATGDCWLLSGVNALSYTEEGRKIIKDSLEYHNGYTIVHTMAGDYVVSDDEIARTKGSLQYSDGDDDMIIFELAVEKIIDDFINGTINLEDNAPDLLNSLLSNNGKTTTPGYSSTTGGWARGLIYLLSGKMGYRETDKEKMSDILEEFKNNDNKNLALGADTDKGDRTVTDVNGKKVVLSGNHAYSIKKIDGQNVTVINPWDSGKEIVLSKEEFLNAFDGIEVCDLSSNNTTQEYINQKAYYNPQGMLEKTTERVENENLTRTKKFTYDKDENLTSWESSYAYDSGFCGKTTYNQIDGTICGQTGNKNTDVLLTYNYDEDGNRYGFQFGGMTADGNLRYNFAEMTDEIGKRISDNYQLMLYQNLDAQDIFRLAKNLNDSEFDKAINYLSQNPNATYSDVINNI